MAKTCECGHNKKAHTYYYGCRRCGCNHFKGKVNKNIPCEDSRREDMDFSNDVEEIDHTEYMPI